MDRVKKAGGNLSNGFWGEKLQGEEEDAGANGQGRAWSAFADDRAGRAVFHRVPDTLLGKSVPGVVCDRAGKG